MCMNGVSYHLNPASNSPGLSAILHQYPFAHACKGTLSQVQANLVEPRQVGDNRLPLLHEMAPNGKFGETLLEEKEHVLYFPLRTKIF